jgi:hypothetical protein
MSARMREGLTSRRILSVGNAGYGGAKVVTQFNGLAALSPNGAIGVNGILGRIVPRGSDRPRRPVIDLELVAHVRSIVRRFFAVAYQPQIDSRESVTG